MKSQSLLLLLARSSDRDKSHSLFEICESLERIVDSPMHDKSKKELAMAILDDIGAFLENRKTFKT